MQNLFLLAFSLILVIKGADLSVKYASNLAQAFRLPKYAVGFLVVAVISILPETFIALNSSLQGIPSFGLGVLLGSNVADLTLIFAIVIFSTASGVSVGSRILQNNKWYPLLLAIPIFVGLDGYYSRVEGLTLIVSGLFFYYWVFKSNHRDTVSILPHSPGYRNFFYLVLGMAVLLLGSVLTVKYGVTFAESIGVSPVLVGMLIVGLGTTLPELLFSLRAIKQQREDLALGDILGTVISDATIVVGILALINPFFFPQKIIYVTALFMVVASLILFAFMRSGRVLTQKEGLFLLLYYIVFVFIEYLLAK